MFFEFSHTAAAPSSIMQKGNILGCATINGLGYKCISGSLITVCNHRNDLHQARNPVTVRKFDKADQVTLMVGTKEFAPLKKRCVFPLDGSKGLTIMLERTPLSDGGFIVNASDPLHKFV
jgi:hypothetical protein